MESFDGQGVSFVSVTQQFNTTSSMGRLTLNVLLSFAQFEREVTGERIRDKIAASKKKGMWMGGPVPLGYDLSNRQLVINPAEADTVRTIFTRYVALKSVTDLQIELERTEFRTKRRIASAGREAPRPGFLRQHREMAGFSDLPDERILGLPEPTGGMKPLGEKRNLSKQLQIPVDSASFDRIKDA